MEPLRVDPSRCRFRALIGVGGIGTGAFFALAGDHTLGREESRAGRFLDRRDYCKLHIIAHYVRTLLGPEFEALPVGRVGGDDAGWRLLDEMAAAGLDLRYVEAVPGGQTLYSLCLLYPDGSGGNLTTDNSASATVDAALVERAAPELARCGARALALAVPEAPLAARRRLLELACEHGAFRVASLTSLEMAAPEAPHILALADLLAINLDEAAALAGETVDGQEPARVARAAIDQADALRPGMLVSITAGRRGSWSWDGQQLHHVPALPVEAVGTAGAGDAHLSGLIAGLAAGLALHQAQALATAVAALSVTSPHTIHPGLDRASLLAFVTDRQVALDAEVMALLAGS